MFIEQKQFIPDTNAHFFMGNIVDYPIHWHNSLEIIIVLEGDIHVKDGFESHAVKSGETIVINKNDLHAIEGVKNKNIVIILNIDINTLKSQYSSIRDTIIVCDSNTDKIKYAAELENIYKIVLELFILTYHVDDTNINIIKQKLNEIVSALIENFRYLRIIENNFANIDRSNAYLDTLGGTMDFIYNNFLEKITLHDISEHENISIYYISHLIKKVSGLTFQEYIGMLRAEASEKLLIASNKSITEIAYESGFSDVKYYTKHFKRWYGKSPGEHRKEYKNYFSTSNEFKNIFPYDLNSISLKLDTYLGEAWREILSKETETTTITIQNQMPQNTILNFNLPILKLDCNDFNAVLIFKKNLRQIVKDIHFNKLIFEFEIKNDALKQLAQLEMLLNDIPKNEINYIPKIVLRLFVYRINRDESYIFIYNQIQNIVLDVCHYYSQEFAIEISYETETRQNKEITNNFISFIKANTSTKNITIIEEGEIEKSISDNIKLSNRNTFDSTNIFPMIIKKFVFSGSSSSENTNFYSQKLIDAFELGKVFHNDSGIIASNGLKKASYQLYSLLNKIGDQAIEIKTNHILSQNGDSITLLLFNFTYQKSDQTYGGKKLKFLIDFKKIHNQLKYSKYTLSEEYGNIYSHFIDYDAPTFLSNDELEIFKTLSYPKVEIGTIGLKDNNLNVEVPPQTVVLFIFSSTS